MNKNPIVSILTTVYNREKYIVACIESVLASTFQDWELIIVDDQSKDQSVTIAKKYAAKDERIQVYVNKQNLGDYPNRNQAVSYANGKYIKFLDADDLIYPHGLGVMVRTMEDFPEAVLGLSQEVVEDYDPYPFILNPSLTAKREFLHRGLLGVAPTATIFRKDIFHLLGGFTGTRFIGDKEMWYKMAFNYPIVKMVPGLVFWRRHDGQEFDLGMKSNAYLINNFELKMNAIQDNTMSLNSIEKKQAIHKVKRRAVREILRVAFKDRNPRDAFILWKTCSLTLSDIKYSKF